MGYRSAIDGVFENSISIQEIIGVATSMMCDEYCKYPEQCENEDELIDKHCNNCPMVKLI